MDSNVAIKIATDSLAIVSKSFALGSDFSAVSQILQISTSLGSALPVVGAILSLIGNFIPNRKHDEIISHLRRLSYQIDRVRDDIKNLGVDIGWELTEHNYRPAVNHIELGMTYLADIGKVTGQNGTNVAKNRLRSLCAQEKCTLNLNILLKGIIGQGLLTSNSILDKFDAAKAKGHRNNISSMATRLLKVASGGIMVVATYETMMHGEEEAKRFIEQHRYASQLKNASQKAKSVLDRCVTNFRQNMLNDLNRFLDKGGSNRDLVGEIRNFMSDKYDWLENFVLVYNDLNGSDKHCIGGDRVDSLHRNDKCGVVFYRGKGQPPRFSHRYDEAYQIVNKIDTDHAQHGYNTINAEIAKKGIGIIGCAVIGRERSFITFKAGREPDLQWGGTLSTKIVTAIGKRIYRKPPRFGYGFSTTRIYHTKFLLLQ